MGYAKARRLLVLTGLAVLGVVVLVMYARRVDSTEVVATLLFVPIFLAFVFRGIVGGAAAAVASIAVYAALRYPAIDAVGIDEFTGLLASRSAAYLIFGVVGGWSTTVLEGSLMKLELYDEIDDETGLYNARHLLHQADLETTRAQRYHTLFSIVLFDVPVALFAPLKSRERRSLLRDLGRLLGAGVRNVDHVVHVRHADLHRFAIVLPETAREGAEVFRARLEERVRAYLTGRGVAVSADQQPARALTVPGDDEAVEVLRAEFTAIDAAQHR